MWRLAKSLVKLRDQVNAAYPNRDRSSDGTIGDQAHRNRKSDHNPDHNGIVKALDIDADLSPTQSVKSLVDVLFQNRDIRIKYIIYNGKITTPDHRGRIQGWKPYNGPNAHKHHAHISVKPLPLQYDDESAWDLGFIVPPQVPQRLFTEGMRGPEIQLLQARLVIRGYYRGTADGIFGPNTKKAVMQFQADEGLRVDGLAGEQTLKALGL